MWFSVSVMEVGMIIMAFIVAAVLARLRQRSWRWVTVGLACVVVASLITPADPASTIVFALAFLLFFLGGTRFYRVGAVSVV
jgi:Sec-independent protein secretion pathway component TatC